MRIRGIGTAKRIAGWARGFIRGGPLVLGYHQVATSNWDPQSLCVSPDNFASQLDLLTTVAQPASLRGLTRALREGRSLDRSFVITLDDGYEDTLEAAAPILERFDVPATVFVTTGLTGKSFWWCEVQKLVEDSSTLPAEIVIELGDHRLQWERSSDSPRERAKLVKCIGDLFRALPFERQEEALGRLRGIFSPDIGGSKIRAMTAEQIAALASQELIEIGSHAVTHTSFSQLDPEQLLSELQQSKAELEAICGTSVVSCSYPNGRMSAQTSQIARQAGYLAGCTSQEERVAPGCDPLMIPRLWVGDWDHDRFSRWLKWWLR